MTASKTPRTTKQWVLASKPIGAPVLSGPDATFKLQTVTLPPLEEGQVLCRVLYFSNDPGQRNFIQSTVAPERLYVPPVPVGAPMRSGILAEVVESAAPGLLAAGDLVTDFHLGTWSELIVLDASAQPQQLRPLAPLPGGLPVTHYLGAIGGTGLTAYAGLCLAGGARPGHTVIVSAAAGATGSMAVQIALRLVGAGRVVGVAGSDAKCAWVRDHLGAHACVNYRSPTFAEDLRAATPGEVDVYFDNVGGAVLDAVLPRMKRHGTVAVCGAVSGYNSDAPMALRNWFEVVSMRITLRGFIMLDYLDKVPQILEELIAAAADGRIKLEGSETIVEARIEEQPATWMRLYSGENQGKLITKLIIDEQ